MNTRRYHSRVAVTGTGGHILRHVHGELAHALVTHGFATAVHTEGRVREVKLAAAASTHARRIGECAPPSIGGVRFTRWLHFADSGLRVIEHHPRATYEED